ncbi:MAG TPA: thioredoxin family protein [Myxococcales bacterium]|nr:thioredoxin family protein [Myxococcales bacterium]
MILALALLASVHGSLDFIEDDYPKALAVARAQHKPVFVDFWATWCHSCLSMQRFVLADPGMKPVANDVVWLAIETETEKNKPVVEKYPLDGWPTFLLIDPANEKILGRFLGSGSVQEIRGFVEDGVRAMHGASNDPAWIAQREGDAARNQGDFRGAAGAYGRAVSLSQADDPQRPERLNLYMAALRRLQDRATCVRTGVAEARGMPATAVGADFMAALFDCAEHDPKARELAMGRLREILDAKDAALAADDRSDALANLSEMYDATSRHEKAAAAMRERAAVLEKAAAAAPDATMASTFDAHRTETYLYLKEPQKAEQLLAEREKQMPGDYNPPARLARVYFEEKKLPEAEAAVGRALDEMPKSQRRVGILELKRKILAAEGKPTAGVLREQLDTLRTLPSTQRKPKQEAELEQKLAAAQKE